MGNSTSRSSRHKNAVLCTRPHADADEIEVYILTYCVPPRDLHSTKAALFDTGAGEWGGYSEVCCEVRVTGCFTPGSSCNPAIGCVGMEERVEEVRVEIRIEGEREKVRAQIRSAMRVLKKVHPYEVPGVVVLRAEAF